MIVQEAKEKNSINFFFISNICYGSTRNRMRREKERLEDNININMIELLPYGKKEKE